ncbi:MULTISPECIES: aspartate aminotransferase family protein [unclassified Mycolicibacterium]|uniref:aminotransferase family protein n=1 Tax=unclassified Mycolicibacterium TaxID=2636767 RepID=UPI0012DF0EA4|nr:MULTISPECIES: aminotransferase class III-fold pyridoxal phosphate-dependent enzyme [unclassified Mycolicibacterium]MUL84740.1 aspartate aminotransferase family protein [Mycolicibacterium sp. CBMA 329]MUL88515.1 aspartate aminotransferase family protein [Mycolicibacterium sp. CBMA 331]MUM00146.1 aspartate aminotransferase family protein [Mycolicibacterium sp. CBMA 334]MUM27810.1 aspartate aminotransferase family protein [Mycolicibacterium sp. CBMA 295]MUM40162.1 aspartate aminotransferase fa
MGLPALLHPFAPVAATEFTNIVSGQGAAVFDDTGQRYVDAAGGLWFCNVGHGRADIAEIVAAQLKTLEAFHIFDRFTNPIADRLAEQIADVSALSGARVFLTNSGSEAIEGAIKIARLKHSAAGDSKRRIIVSRTPSYHGVTYGALSVTGNETNQEHFGAMLPDVRTVPFLDLAAMEELFAAEGSSIAALITEPLSTGAGVYPSPPGYLQRLRELCDEHGALLIMDEVVCGFGRLGRWFGTQRYGVVPDIMVFGKGVTSGYLPLAGFVAARSVLDELEATEGLWFRHGHTFCGHPGAAAAALAVMQVIGDEGLLARADRVGARLRDGLTALADRGLLTDVRGDGAVWAVTVAGGRDSYALRQAMMPRGVIARPLGGADMGFCPPLVIDDHDIDLCVETLEQAIAEVPAAVGCGNE